MQSSVGQEIERNLHNKQLQTEIVRKQNTFDYCLTHTYAHTRTQPHVLRALIWHLINNEIENLRCLANES